MSTESSQRSHDFKAPLPRTFSEYLRSFGPGFVIVLTWLGAGDVVDSGISGANYGYALMWIIVLALVMRFLFVSLIAKYQLCNQHNESVLDGLARLHPWFAPFLMVVSVIMGHFYGSFMAVGIGEAWVNLTGRGEPWQWALLWTAVALGLVFRPAYARVEFLFKGLLAVLAISFIGVAIWVGPNPEAIVRGTLAFALPEKTGPFDSLLLATSLIGALGGSLMNLAYPYFLEQKGWRGPEYRRVQMYDFLLAVTVMILLNLAIWTLGAELVHSRGETIEDLDGLTALLGLVLGKYGRMLFLLGVFAAVFTSMVGNSLGLACMASHGYLRWKSGPGPLGGDYQTAPIYRGVVLWVLISPLIWTAPGMPGFVELTLIVNSLQVVLIPILAGGVWWITAGERYIGAKFKNRWYENLVMLIVFIISLWAMVGAVRSVSVKVQEMF